MIHTIIIAVGLVLGYIRFGRGTAGHFLLEVYVHPEFLEVVQDKIRKHVEKSFYIPAVVHMTVEVTVGISDIEGFPDGGKERAQTLGRRTWLSFRI